MEEQLEAETTGSVKRRNRLQKSYHSSRKTRIVAINLYPLAPYTRQERNREILCDDIWTRYLSTASGRFSIPPNFTHQFQVTQCWNIGYSMAMPKIISKVWC